MAKGYDPKSYELAEYFLAEDHWGEEDIADLAQTIQDAIELWFTGKEPK
jgi:hypothetical protein